VYFFFLQIETAIYILLDLVECDSAIMFAHRSLCKRFCTDMS